MHIASSSQGPTQRASSQTECQLHAGRLAFKLVFAGLVRTLSNPSAKGWGYESPRAGLAGVPGRQWSDRRGAGPRGLFVSAACPAPAVRRLKRCRPTAAAAVPRHAPGRRGERGVHSLAGRLRAAELPPVRRGPRPARGTGRARAEGGGAERRGH